MLGIKGRYTLKDCSLAKVSQREKKSGEGGVCQNNTDSHRGDGGFIVGPKQHHKVSEEPLMELLKNFFHGFLVLLNEFCILQDILKSFMEYLMDVYWSSAR